MRPLVSVLMREQVSFPDFIDLIKEVFIETAIRDGLESSVPRTVARVAIATGVSKSEVRSYVFQPDELKKPEPVLNSVLAEIVHKWNTDVEYTGPYGGVARELDFDSTSGVNFVALAKSTSSDIEPNTLLSELIASGAIQQRVNDEGQTRYRVTQRAFVFQNAVKLSPGMADHFATVMTDLAATLAYNFNPNTSNKRVERAVYSTEGLTQEQVDEFVDFAKKSVTQLMVELDDLLAAMSKAAGTQAAAERMDVGLNVFQYVRERDAQVELRSLMDES